ncbi:AAA family ATPase [uncultured Treponema sp.]|uniref:AAA family ATPase n=1 Tax=uncultured Treponema sp. TaxID=162155 RepID=UPI0027D9CB73|nr:AAA family ATPase [uncultured Treponema sp.]
MEENWYPAENEYESGITKEQWKEFVTDRNIFTQDSLTAFACIQKAALATCTDMAEEFGRTKNFYNNVIWRTGEKVHELADCPLSLRSDETERFWSICCLGRKLQNGRIELKIRPELEEAFDETGVLKGIEVMENENRNYYVISPNVWNDNNFDYLLDYMIQNHCVLMGWQTDNPKGKLFSNLKTGDCIVVALRRSWKFNYYFIGTLSSDSIEEYDDAQKRSLENFTLLEDKNCDFLKTWSAAGSSQIPAIAKIDKIKNPEIISAINDILNGESIMPNNSLADQLTDLLQHAHNLILHGAPGTGKTFLAKEIAKKMDCSQNEIGFVQFHPSYDYTDFVEGLRPKSQNNGEIGFERKDGVFKEFCKRALQNLIDSKKSVEVLEKESSINDKVENFLEKARYEKIVYEITRGNKFFIVDNSEKNIFIEIPANEKVKELVLPKNDLIELLNSDYEINSANEIRDFFNRKWGMQQDSYILTLYKKIRAETQTSSVQKIEKIQEKKYLFIIDEINRGELSKIFGELFYAVEPGYRVSYDDLKKHQSGEKTISTIRTQYANLETGGNTFDKALRFSNPSDYGHFFIPENVYMIGTMNDIDRSVDTMDFAFRRRFAFREIKASENLEMLSTLGEIADKAKARLKKLNEEISKITELSSPSSYHIGGAYFLKLNDFEGDSNERFQKLWNYHLEGLLKEYLRGTENAEENFAKLRSAYFGLDSAVENNSEEEDE